LAANSVFPPKTATRASQYKTVLQRQPGSGGWRIDFPVYALHGMMKNDLRIDCAINLYI
jgi:hypothetical protein